MMKAREGEHPYGDTGQIVLLVVFMAVWIADSFFLRKTTFLAGSIPLVIRLFIFALSLIAALLLARSGHRVIEGKKRPESVMRTGAFKHVRHPLYLASILLYFGLFFSTASLAGALLWVVIVVFYDYIATYEEMLLVQHYGDEYSRYRASTGKWLPLPNKGNRSQE